MEKPRPVNMRLKHRCCTLPFLIKVSMVLLAVCSTMLFLQSIWGNAVKDDNVSKSGKIISKNINSGAVIQRELLPKPHSETRSSECKVPRFISNSTVPSNVVCKRISPRPDSCQLARDLYRSRKVETCDHQDKHQLCRIKSTWIRPQTIFQTKILEVTSLVNHHPVNIISKDKVEGKEYVIDCDQKKCPGMVSLGTINPAIGVVHWEELSSMEELQTHLNHLLLTSKPEAVFGFCFIKCPLELPEQQAGQGDEAAENYDGGRMEGGATGEEFENSYQAFDREYFLEEIEDDTWAQQLLLLPLKRYSSPKGRKSTYLNINVILLDSVSHSHFYRSLPKTIQALRQIDRMKSSEVFNFNLMQSLKGRTYENLQMLFSGVMYNPEKPFGIQDMPPDPLGTNVLLEGFKHQGYQTLWMEDLCWTWEWGIAKNFVVHSPKEMLSFRWQKLKDAMLKGGIDQLGLALANCEILRLNGHNDPFHGPPAICYNGEYQHAYLLKYVKALQKTHQHRGIPYFNYIELNIGHDDLGTRIQGLDSYLADFLKVTASQPNTMTVLLADHGNSYGSFIQKSEEGRIEMFHPSFFIMLSKETAHHFSSSQIDALRTNQDRLVSIMDVHYMLRYLAYPGLDIKVAAGHRHYDADPMGLLREISCNRTCDHIPRIQPNVCICQDYDSRVSNDTSRVVFAEFALGELNNAIQKQFVEANPEAKSGFGHCQPLQALWFTNVRENFHGDSAIIKLDLYVKAGKNASQAEEIFFVTLMASSKSSSENGLRLLSYERLTAYSQYGACADKGVATKLCVCSLLTSDRSRKITYKSSPKWHEVPSFFSTHASTIKEVTSCLFLYERRTMNGVVLEVSSECKDMLYLVEVDAKSQNIITSRDLPVNEILLPGMRTFLIAFLQEIPKHTWNLEYSLQYTEHHIH